MAKASSIFNPMIGVDHCLIWQSAGPSHIPPHDTLASAEKTLTSPHCPAVLEYTELQISDLFASLAIPSSYLKPMIV
jgi:hypothetical protein